jgi:uncharacterized protein YqeY
MSLKQRLTEDMKAAMRAKDAPRLGAIRFLQAAIKQKEVDERTEADDASILSIVDKLIKQRRDSIAQFEQAGRTDLVDKERFELTVLQDYLPRQLDEAELDAEVEAAIAAVPGAAGQGAAAMGKVMAILKPRIAGRADMGAASARVKRRLAG